MMGGTAPQAPRDLSLFSTRVDGFALVVICECRTIEELDRRIGQRRDATRAPTQARSGWRPSNRFLDSPPHHLRDGEILSKQWGPPHNPGIHKIVHENGFEHVGQKWRSVDHPNSLLALWL